MKSKNMFKCVKIDATGPVGNEFPNGKITKKLKPDVRINAKTLPKSMKVGPWSSTKNDA